MEESDQEAFLSLFNEQWPFWGTSPTEFASELAMLPADQQRRWIARIGERVVAVASCDFPLWAPTSRYSESMLIVHPDHRRTGIGSELYRRISEFTRDQLKLDGIHCYSFENEPEGLAFAEHRGFTEVERNVYVALDLRSATDLPDAQLPDGLTITSLAERPDLKAAYHDILTEVVPDLPSSESPEMIPYETWLSALETSGKYRLDSCFVVIDEDGNALALAELELQATCPELAWHGFTAVRRAARRRGIARALKAHTIRHARDVLGLERLVTENEARNEGMREINREFGYKPVPAGICLRGPLAASAASLI
jgi:GNAT superfamily N-acetyltransferase